MRADMRDATLAGHYVYGRNPREVQQFALTPAQLVRCTIIWIDMQCLTTLTLFIISGASARYAATCSAGTMTCMSGRSNTGATWCTVCSPE